MIAIKTGEKNRRRAVDSTVPGKAPGAAGKASLRIFHFAYPFLTFLRDSSMIVLLISIASQEQP